MVTVPRGRVHAGPFAVGALALLAFLPGCGGGGGGGGGATAARSFTLQSIAYGRPVDRGNGPELVSPLSLVDRDPRTGQEDPLTLRPLAPSVNLADLVALPLGPTYTPRVVPRDAVFVLTFDANLDPASVVADRITAAGIVRRGGSLQVRRSDDVTLSNLGVPVALSVRGNQLWVSFQTATTSGLPAHPITLDSGGDPLLDPTGFVKLVLPTLGPNVLRSLGGGLLAPRADGLGEPDQPIGINPGNALVDFLTAEGLLPTNESYHGHLPDQDPPRLVRMVRRNAVVDLSQGDQVYAASLLDADARFDTAANQGDGEWAGQTLVLRPGQPDKETHTVLRNGARRLFLEDPFLVLPRDGDAYKLTRREFFEPDPTSPIDPARFDPFNPENGANAVLENFIEVFEVDAQGNPVGGALPFLANLPAFSELRLTFSEPLERTSLGQWESLRVAEDPDPGPGGEVLTRLVLSPDGTQVTLQPALVDPATGAVQVVGWGPGIRALELAVTSVPSLSFLRTRLDAQTLQAFLDQGWRGVTDARGQPLGYPAGRFDPQDPVYSWAAPFLADDSVSSFQPPPVAEDWGVLVHRFRGLATPGVDPATGQSGIGFRDQVDYYLPLVDVHAVTNGVLAGPPVASVTRVVDDSFPPPDSPFTPAPFGSLYPLGSVVPSAPAPHDGARFQHLFRDVEASPAPSLKGTLLDLVRVSFAPIGGNVTTDVYDDVSVHAAESYLRPLSMTSGGVAAEPFFGLSEPFDFNTYYKIAVLQQRFCPNLWGIEAPNVYDRSLTTVVPAGTTWTVTQANLYRPAGTTHNYHPWPAFRTPFAYNNGDYPPDHQAQRQKVNQDAGLTVWVDRDQKHDQWGQPRGGDSLLLEYRIRPQASLLSYRNGFTYSRPFPLPGPPYHRAFSIGVTGNPLDPDSSDNRAKCATSPIGGVAFGDNRRYFAALDYVKSTARIRSPFVQALTGGGGAVDWYPALLEPSSQRLPPGTVAALEYAGASDRAGTGATAYDPDPSLADGRSHLSFRLTLRSNVPIRLAPTVDLVAIPYRRN